MCTKRAAAGFSGNSRFYSAQRTSSTRSSGCTTRRREPAPRTSLRGRQWRREARPLARATAPPPPTRYAFGMPDLLRRCHAPHAAASAPRRAPSGRPDGQVPHRETSSSRAARRAEQCPGTPSRGSWRLFVTRTNGGESIALAPPATWVASGRFCACTRPARNKLRMHTQRTTPDISARPRRCAELGIIGVRRLCANVALETTARNAHAPAAKHPMWEITGNSAGSGGPNRPFKTP